MARKEPVFDSVATAEKIAFDPFVAAFVVEKKDDEAGGASSSGLTLILDSRNEHDTSRAVVKTDITEVNPVFTLDCVKGQNSFEWCFPLSVREQGAEGRELLRMTYELQRKPFSISTEADAQELASALLKKFRADMLTELGEAVTGAQEQTKRMIVHNVGVQPLAASEIVPPRKVRGGSGVRTERSPAWKSPLVWFAALLVGAALVYGASGLFSEKDNSLAGVDPVLRQQMEAAGINGGNNPAPVNVTEQTLKAMGLDPGRAANLGCLAQ